ncbi:DUF1801 domain-containing protein [Sphingomonas sp. BT-65]|uniref:DUF1801 domain-containing protein n=1 Tax=Sphingomonas sp. BT-65 TaxID=2989821 RepID=UPI0022364507|nr:DUF1801 domain-containing protein [Sphingomonas sp. BT-65]MCW4461665.1 DUF1801 domain-containing protein [Sphingomonas sp. BT-65]
MAEIKTKPTEISAAEFIDAVENPIRREEAKAVCAMMERVTGEPPRMWGPSIVGFGSYHYKYDSGHEGTMCRLGFSPRKAQLVLYVLTGAAGEDQQLAKLGKHKTGKSCLYINKLAEVDMAVLEDMVRDTLAYMDEKYPA